MTQATRPRARHSTRAPTWWSRLGATAPYAPVAAELAGTDIPLAIIPMGTGNLFARNLDLPLGNTAALLRIALDGENVGTRRGLA